MNISLTRHAMQRLSQRGFRPSTVETIFLNGMNIGDQEYIMTAREIDMLRKELKAQLQALDKLHNRKLVIEGDTVITGYCLTKNARRKCRIRMRSTI
jgi:hypothetical protein